MTGVEKGYTGPTGHPGKLERKLRVCVTLSWQKNLQDAVTVLRGK